MVYRTAEVPIKISPEEAASNRERSARYLERCGIKPTLRWRIARLFGGKPTCQDLVIMINRSDGFIPMDWILAGRDLNESSEGDVLE